MFLTNGSGFVVDDFGKIQVTRLPKMIVVLPGRPKLNTANNNLKQTIFRLEPEVTVKTAELVKKSDIHFRLLIENERLTQQIQNLEIELIHLSASLYFVSM
ncbi:hypothetical protein CAEBREN_16631 [Caenorhabditis brenneri]|uniref:Uncharacterized protein n=1 Tax=Caenorhabditis brenneri TaxID=135651 RepID=G0NDD7_CAEBE|nr:hypothetical protein CAEBREN_16631 [Caenorhabditis brenneri]